MLRRLFPVFVTIFVFAVSVSAQIVQCVILHTNDVHGQIRSLPDPRSKDPKPPLVGGYTELVQAIDEERALVAHSILLDGGDWYQGTPEGTLSKGRAIVELMNAVGYDAAVLGNHEFDCGQEALVDLLRLSRFQVLGSNVVLSEGDVSSTAEEIFRRTRQPAWFQVEGVRVAVDGLVCEEAPKIISPGLLDDLNIVPEVSAARSSLARMVTADVKVLVNHVGRDRNVIIGRDVPGFDVIIGGHDHRASIDRGTVIPSTGTLVAQAATHTRALGIITLQIDVGSKKVVEKSARLRWIEPKPELRIARITPIIERYEAAVREKMDVPVADVPTLINRSGSVESPSPLGAWLCTAMLDATDADVAVHNHGGIRASLPAGNARVREFFEISPFGNRLTVVTLEVRHLRALAEQTLADFGRGCAFFGLEIDYGLGEDGHLQVLGLRKAGDPLSDDMKLKVVTTDFLASAKEKADAFAMATERRDFDLTLLDASIAFAKKQGSVVVPPGRVWGRAK